MTFQEIDIAMAEGSCDAFLAHPDGPGPFPAILYGTDVGGLRAEVRSAIERIAAEGYLVLAPNLFYRLGRAPVADMAELAKDMPRLFALVGTLTPEVMHADLADYIAYLAQLPDAKADGIGVVGYCMSGGLALRAAAYFSDKVAVAASIHGSFLASEEAGSPHRDLMGTSAEIFVGLAQEDPIMPAEQIERLEQALEASGAKFEIEVFPGTHHGFAVEGGPTYDPEQSKRHLARLFELFDRTLR